MYKHILAALDGSTRAPQVLHHAAEIAARTGAVLHLGRAVNLPLGIPVDALMLTGDELTARLLEYGAQELTTLAEGVHTTHTPVLWGQRLCRYGAPAQVVLELADELHADLIVLGSHGYDMIDRLLGTTAARVVNHARCSVLVVRGDRGPAA
jgi:universal stress protein F